MQRCFPVRPGLRWCRFSAVLFALCLIASAAAAQEVSDADCADCHEDISEKFHDTLHGVLFGGGAMPVGGACQACHGPGAKHVDSEDPADIINPSKVDLINGESTCQGCHGGHALESWAMSEHRSAGVTCSDCHNSHAAYDQYEPMEIPDRCMACHTDVRAAGYMPSHHPVAEGKVSCNDCHDPHGGDGLFAQEGNTREKCFKCHAGHEGPFVFDHAPAAEDCMICHSPHGSVADNLLKQSEPSLCLNCHSMHFHAGVVSVDGEFDTPQAPDRKGTSTPDGWKKVMLTKCTQCHTEIHGSDLPSQSISGQGRALTR
jgi:DmsE family decaheme c-type cytochrome